MKLKRNEIILIILIILGIFIICRVIKGNYYIEGFDIKKIEKAAKLNEVGPNIAKGLKVVYDDEKKQFITVGKSLGKVILPEFKVIMEKNLIPKVESALKSEIKPGFCKSYDNVCKSVLNPVFKSQDLACNEMVSEMKVDICGGVDKLIDPELTAIKNIKTRYDSNSGIKKIKKGGTFIPNSARDAARSIDNYLNKVISGLNNIKKICPSEFKKLDPCNKTKKFQGIILNNCYKGKKEIGCK